MAEQTESPRPQQPPFTEGALKRRNEWLEEAGREVTNQPQSNIDRIFLLKEFRQVGFNYGFEEKTEPKYEISGDKHSDIVMQWDTLDLGLLGLRLQLDGLRTTLQSSYVGIDTSSYTGRSLINEGVRIRNKLRECGVNTEQTLLDAEGNVVDLPENEIKEKVIVEPDMLPQVPLRDQEFSFDPHTGAWYGSPKTKSS